MILKKSLFYFLLFFFIFNTNFIFMPYPTRVVIAVAGMCVFILNLLQKNQNNIIKKYDLKSFIWFILIGLIGLISLIVNQENDFSFYKEELLVLIVIPFFGAYLIAYVGKENNLCLCDFLRSYVNINVFQSIIIITSLIIPSFKLFLINTQKWNDRTMFIMTYSGRMCGIGARFDYGSVIFSISLICTVLLYYLDKQEKPLKYLILYLIQAIAGGLLARSILVGLLCSIILFIFIGSDKYSRQIKLVRISILICILVVLIFFFRDELNALKLKYINTIKWVFEFFYTDELVREGKTSNSWTVILHEMYFIPDNIKTWLIGDGRFTNLKGNPYMKTDPLYMRYLLFSGIFGLTAFIGFFFSTFKSIFYSSKEYSFSSEYEDRMFRIFLKIVFVFSLLMYLKSNTHSFYFVFYLLFFIKLGNKKEI